MFTAYVLCILLNVEVDYPILEFRNIIISRELINTSTFK